MHATKQLASRYGIYAYGKSMSGGFAVYPGSLSTELAATTHLGTKVDVGRLLVSWAGGKKASGQYVIDTCFRVYRGVLRAFTCTREETEQAPHESCRCNGRLRRK